MNILGHSWTAVNAVPGKRDLLIIGSLLPESFPFIKDNPFSFEEIHEGGEALLEFLKKNYPHRRDLALGMLTHGKKFGADGLNRYIEDYEGGKKEALLREIANASGVSLKTAKFRFHNFLWWGVDLWILKEYPDFAREVRGVIKEANVKEISDLLAEAFQKDRQATESVFKKLFREIYRPEDLTSVEGLARTWTRQAAGLPEKDEIDIPKAVEVIKECAGLLENDWQGILKTMETKVGEGLKKCYYHIGLVMKKEGLEERKEGFLEGKIALVTGGGGGIGWGIATEFAREGAKVAIVDINEERGKEVLDLVEKISDGHCFCQADIRDIESFVNLLNKVRRQLGVVDILVNNAGG